MERVKRNGNKRPDARFRIIFQGAFVIMCPLNDAAEKLIEEGKINYSVERRN